MNHEVINTELVDALKWRAAIKEFSSKPVSEQDFNELLETLHWAPGSMGFQPFKYLIVKDEETRKKLVPASYGQEKVAVASHVIIFCRQIEFGMDDVNAYVEMVKKQRPEQPAEALSGFTQMATGAVNGMSDEIKKHWMDKQLYIAMGFFMLAAAEKKIDTCPMEGFVPEQVSDILGLKAKNLHPSAIVAVGYRDEEKDGYSTWKKVRKPHNELFEVI